MTGVFPPLSLHRPRIGFPPASQAALSEARSAERETIHAITTPKAAPKPPNAGKHHLCSPRPRRTRLKPPKLPPRRLARPPYSSKPARTGGIWTQSGFFSTAAAATFLCQDKGKWGPQLPSRARGATSPYPRPAGRPSLTSASASAHRADSSLLSASAYPAGSGAARPAPHPRQWR